MENQETQVQAQPSAQPQAPQQVTHVIVQGKKSNGLGTAGFVCALVSIFLCWIPFVNFILWFLGLIFSFIGMFKSPRGLAIAGFILSILGIIIGLVLVAALGLAFL